MKEIMEKEFDSIITNSNCNVSIIIKNLNETNFIYECNSNEKLISASLIKIPILLTVLEKVKQGFISLYDIIVVKKEDVLEDTKVFDLDNENYTVLELLNWMIITSDNTATNILIDKFGMNYINDYIENELKLEKTSLQRKMLDNYAIENGYQNYTSQNDMLKVFTQLFNKEVLTEELCDLAINILAKQRCQDQVMRYIYEDVFYAHKTGYLDYLNHDVGVMKINDDLFYVGISFYNCKDIEGNKKLSGKLGKKIFDIINSKGG